jgi:hypothetical protein
MEILKMKILIFILVILISNTIFAKQKFYKWTDESGNIHYSSEKPDNSKADEIQIKTNQPKLSQNFEVSNKDENEEILEKSYKEKHYEKKKKTKETAQENKAHCQQARQTLAKFQQKVRMSSTDKKSGKKVFLDDSKRAEIINKAKKEMRKHCK